MAESKKRPALEHVLIAAKAALAATKYGGALATLLQEYIPSTLEIRRDEMLQRFGEDLERLKDRFTDERLSSRDFNITMVKVLRDVIVETHEEKEKAFRAILLNEASTASPHSEKDLFIKITEDLTGDHIRLFKVLSDARQFHNSNPAIASTWQEILIPNRMEPGSPDLQGAVAQAMSGISSDHFAILLSDLQRYGLILEGDVITVETFSGGFVKRTKPLGDRYIKYITLPQ